MSPRWCIGVGFCPRFGSLRPGRCEYQVALLIRDRASGKLLFEARAVSEGLSPASSAICGAIFQAALADFLRLGINPRRVDVVAGP